MHLSHWLRQSNYRCKFPRQLHIRAKSVLADVSFPRSQFFYGIAAIVLRPFVSSAWRSKVLSTISAGEAGNF